MTMHKMLFSSLAAGTVAMGLLLGAGTASAATVLFGDPAEPNKATGIQDLNVAGTSYNVTFDVLAFAFNYSANIPLDNNGQYKLQVYADGFAPTVQVFDEFSPNVEVRMARAAECQ